MKRKCPRKTENFHLGEKKKKRGAHFPLRGEEDVLFSFSGSLSNPTAWVVEQGRELGGQSKFLLLLLNMYNLQHNLVWCPEIAASGVGNCLWPGCFSYQRVSKQQPASAPTLNLSSCTLCPCLDSPRSHLWGVLFPQNLQLPVYPSKATCIVLVGLQHVTGQQGINIFKNTQSKRISRNWSS